MKRANCFALVAVFALVLGSTATGWGRGFGGFHGGGGGFRGGMGGAAHFGGERSGLGGRNSFGGLGADNLGSERFGGNGLGGNGFDGVGAGARPNQDQLGRFLGLPSDGGMHALGNGLGAGRVGGIGADAARRPFGRMPAADMALRGDSVRRGFYHRDYYSAAWYRRYPGAWFPARWGYGEVWAAATWDSMIGWLGYGAAEPTYYDYGNNVVYQDNSVYVDGQNVATADQYYQQAQAAAASGAQAQATDDDWLPLGVFAMSHEEQTKPTMVLQLAVNKQGVIRGNYTNSVANHNMTVRGAVDKKTQRAAWTIGDNVDNVVETGVYNLTKNEAPALVHFGKDRTEQWLLVRLNQNDDTAAEKDSPPK